MTQNVQPGSLCGKNLDDRHWVALSLKTVGFARPKQERKDNGHTGLGQGDVGIASAERHDI
jgi:hypothetical protein